MLKTLLSPQSPKEAIESRRNPCYGFTIVADIQEHKELLSLLKETRDEILNIIDPNRAEKQRPIKSPLYIKQKFFHATVFGMTPLLDQKQFIEIYTHEQGILNHDAMDKMCSTLQTHLDEQKPYLEPLKCELINNDGTILAKFTYKTESNDKAPLLTLANQLDPDKKFSKWDANNPSRYANVAVVICVIDKDKMNEKLEAIQHQIDLATIKLKKLGKMDITQLHFIKSYDKRTLSLKHISIYANINRNNVCIL